MLSQSKIERYTMLHLGDITKINGAEAPLVDCIIGGSPCQDLSVAGKRAVPSQKEELEPQPERSERISHYVRGRKGRLYQSASCIWQDRLPLRIHQRGRDPGGDPHKSRRTGYGWC